MKSKGTLKQSRGAVAPLVAIMLILIVVCVALVVDLGHIHNVKVELQRAVDAAALAGAQNLSNPNTTDDIALATAGANSVDSQPIAAEISSGKLTVTVDLGRWKTGEEFYGQPASVRYTSLGIPPPPLTQEPNAVKVTASRDVDHVFFFFVGSTNVTVDAIAVAEPKPPTLPLALVSCIPTGSSKVQSPGLTICDIATYKFNNDTDDTAAWTSLTFNPANKTTIEKFMAEDGNELFNRIVYGDNEPPDDDAALTEGLEGAAVAEPSSGPFDSAFPGCSTNSGETIDCGLGGRFTSPTVPSGNDPLNFDPLPRWFSPEFNGVIFQDGYLNGDKGVSLADLKAGTPNPYGDSRFTDSANGFIDEDLKLRLNRVVKHAGYPPVWVNNGTITKTLDDFLEKVSEDASKKENHFIGSALNAPFNDSSATDGYGKTLRLTIPIIFAGTCDEWKALSHPGVGKDDAPIDTPLYYVGLANLLITRGWKGPEQYCNGAPVSLTTFPPACNASSFDPGLTTIGVNTYAFGCEGKLTPAALEGLIKEPGAKEEEGPAITKIYLVE